MDAQGTQLALRTNQPATTAPPSTTLSATLEKRWQQRCTQLALSEKEKNFFESHRCDDLADYVGKLEAACRNHTNNSAVFKLLDSLQPFFKAVELFMPAVKVGVQANPAPASIVLGGIIGVLETTNRLERYQKLTLQLLARMGQKAQILRAYKKEIYEDDYPVQEALIEVYCSILQFCHKAIEILDKKGALKAKIAGFKLIAFRDFESYLGEEVQNFETRLEDLEAKASICDRKRQKQIRAAQEEHSRELGQMASTMNEHFQRSYDLELKIEKRNEEIRQRKDNVKREKEKRRIIRWLSPFDFRETYEDLCKQQLEGTGTWLLDLEQYQSWRSGVMSDVLWIRGKPGCGKSLLAAIAIFDLNLGREPGTALAYAFCRRADKSQNTPSAVLGGLLAQICEQRQMISSTLQRKYLESRSETPSIQTIIVGLKDALTNFTTVYITVDGLDECSQAGQLADELLNLEKDEALPPIKLLILSRDEFSIQQRFQSYNKVLPDHDLNKEDLQAYISFCFPDGDKENVHHQIREICLEKANGMFLWVRLLSENLDSQPMTGDQKLQRAKSILPSLFSIYSRIFEDICLKEETLRSTAFLVLLWVTHATRPLDEQELLEAVAVSSAVTNKRELSKHKYSDAHRLVALCGNLVCIDMNRDFQLCHDSVRDFLSSNLLEFQDEQKQAQRRLAENCFNYLFLEDFERGPANSPAELRSMFRKYPFLLYSAKYWGYHARMANEDLLLGPIQRLVDSKPRRELSLQIIRWRTQDPLRFWIPSDSSTSLHILAAFGLQRSMLGYPSMATQMNLLDGLGLTMLEYAIFHRQQETCQWLVEQADVLNLRLDRARKLLLIHGPARLGWTKVLEMVLATNRNLVNTKLEPTGSTPLGAACEEGQEAAAAILIANGASVNLGGGSGNPPLVKAIWAGHHGIVNLLLRKKANPNCLDANLTPALLFAAEHKDSKMLEALLDYGADAHSIVPDENKYTALHVAALEDSMNVIIALKPETSLFAKKSGNGRTALHYAALNNSLDAATELLKTIIPKDETDSEGETALYIAASRGHHAMVKLLVKGGCNDHICTLTGETVLHAAARTGDASVVQSLGPECLRSLVNKPAQNNETPLHTAVVGGSTDIVKYMLRAGARCEVKGVHDASPLHYAAHFGHTSIAHLLLKSTGNASPRDEYGNTPLHFAVRVNEIAFVKEYFHLCGQLGISLEYEAQNDSKRSPLHAALLSGYEEIALFLMEQGFTSNPDIDGSYLIHRAAWSGWTTIVQTLLDHEGAKCKGYLGRTPLFIAASRGHLQTAKVLMEHSSDLLNETDDAKETPLFAALRSNPEMALYFLGHEFDPKLINEHGDTLLHVAARQGEIRVIKTLLELNLSVVARNVFDETPLHVAVEHQNLQTVQELLHSDSTAINSRNLFGASCAQIAARSGNVQMFEALCLRGASFTGGDVFGRTCVWDAANNGHLPMLKCLDALQERFDAANTVGVTPLDAAVGYPQSLLFILKRHPQLVDRYNPWTLDSPLTRAAVRGFTKSIRLLLSAGADPHHRDAAGCSALDFAARHPPSLREMHAAGFFHKLPDHIEQQEIRHESIRSCCEEIRLHHKDLSQGKTYYVMFQTALLGAVLRSLRDFEAASICLMDIYWSLNSTKFKMTLWCSLCHSENFRNDFYVCTQCYQHSLLCEKCYKGYQKAGKALPPEMTELFELEDLIQPLRVLIPYDLSIGKVSMALLWFNTSSDWIDSVLERYERWQLKYNTDSRFVESLYPEYNLLKFARKAFEILKEDWSDADTAIHWTDQLRKVDDQYKVHQRANPTDKEKEPFLCKAHDYFHVSEKEKQKIQSQGLDLDSASGKVTSHFLDTLLTKYSDVTEREHMDQLPRYSKKMRAEAMNNVDQDVVPKRKVHRSSSASKLRVHQPRGVDTADSDSCDVAETIIGTSIKRAVTSPISDQYVDEKHALKVNIKKRGAQEMTTAPSFADPEFRASTNGTFPLSVLLDGGPPAYGVSLRGAFQEVEGSTSEQSWSKMIDNGSAPESYAENDSHQLSSPHATTEQNRLSFKDPTAEAEQPVVAKGYDANVQTSASDVSSHSHDASAGRFQMVYQTYVLCTEFTLDFDTWRLAVLLAEEMEPGFIDRYFQQLRDTHELSTEVAEPHPESNVEELDALFQDSDEGE